MKMIMIALITLCIIICSKFQRQTQLGWGSVLKMQAEKEAKAR